MGLRIGELLTEEGGQGTDGLMIQAGDCQTCLALPNCLRAGRVVCLMEPAAARPPLPSQAPQGRGTGVTMCQDNGGGGGGGGSRLRGCPLGSDLKHVLPASS